MLSCAETAGVVLERKKEQPMGLDTATPAWSPIVRILFRFSFVYFVLYLLPFPLNAIPGTEVVNQWYQGLWDAIVPWVGSQLFHVTITVRPNGSGDTTYNYVQVFCFLTLALATTLLWSLLDRKRPSYPRLHAWLRVYVRFALFMIMLTYGAVKVIKSQFPYPSLDRLLQPFGDASPMGLLWTFMGASVSYNFFAGTGEILGGVLLTARRTTLLGGLVCIGVLSNIVMLNFSYDVPVKLYSLHLLAMALFLAAPDARRLIDLLLLGRGVKPMEFRPFLGRIWLHRGVLLLRTALVVGMIGLSLYGAHESLTKFGDLAPKSPLLGIWNVEEFESDGKDRPPLVADGTRWRRVIFDYPGVFAVQLMSDSRQRYTLKLDPDQRTLALTKREDPAWHATLNYQQPEPARLTIEGVLEGRKVRAKLRRADESAFLLRSRGFHWINEYPFNR
jgi:hypothetical protein